MNTEKINIAREDFLRVILLIVAILGLLYAGASLLLPLVVSAIIATLLDKPTTKLIKWGLPQWAAITLSVLILLVFFLLLTWLVSRQVSNIADDWPLIRNKAFEKFEEAQTWAQQELEVNLRNYFADPQRLINRVRIILGVFFNSLTNLVSQSLIILVYIILLLMQKEMFHKFFKKLLGNPKAVDSILEHSAKTINNYLIGKGKIMFLLFVIYFVGFYLCNVPYAGFLALFAAVFSIIPYIGNFIGGGVAFVLAYLSSGITSGLFVVGVISLAQLLENYLLTPLIIGDEIDLNPFITVFGVILFSAIWGMVGAIISLPIIGVLKVFFEHTEGMEPYAYLLKQDKDA